MGSARTSTRWSFFARWTRIPRLVVPALFFFSCNPVARVPKNDPPPDVHDLKVKINEIMVSNTILADSTGDFPPWVELFNPTDEAVNLRGVPLSDDLGDAEKWTIPDVPEAVMEPHGFLVIFCDGAPPKDHELHAGFKLEPGLLQLILNGGSDIVFFDASGLEPDQSGGRFPNGEGNATLLSMPTPGASNKEPKAAPEKFLRGDANEDHRVNVADMTAIVAMLFQGRAAPACRDRLDANDDGVVNITDALYVGQSLFQHGPPPPEPFPAEGLDPTDDELPCPGEAT